MKRVLLLLPITLLLWGCSVKVIVQCEPIVNTGIIATWYTIDTSSVETSQIVPVVKSPLYLYKDWREETWMVLFCVNDINIENKKDGYKILLNWFYLDTTGKHIWSVRVPDSWINEQQWWYWCLEANMRLNYCNYIPEDLWWDNSIWLVAWNIEWKTVAKDRNNNYQNIGHTSSCEDFTEEDKYEQKYTIPNVMSKYKSILTP